MYDYSPTTCLIKDVDGQLYNIIDLWKGIKKPVDISTLQYSYAPRSCLVRNVDGTDVNIIDTILAVANGSSSGTSSLEEVIQARGKYSTLGERLDKENEKVYETINSKDFIPFEGEDIKVEHSKIGFTKDMQIEGMTYQNLIKMSASSKGSVFFQSSSWVYRLSGKNTVTIINLCSKPIRFQTSYKDESYSRGVKIQANTTTVVNINENEILRDIIANVEDGWATNDETQLNEFKRGVVVLNGNHENITLPYFEGIKSVGEKENKISILSMGKNMVNMNTTINIPTSKSGSSNKFPARIKKGTTVHLYAFSDNKRVTNRNIAIRFYDVNGNDTCWWSLDGNTMTVTYDVVECKIFWNNLIDSNITINQLCIVREPIMEHIPYTENKKEILLPFENGLKGLSNVYDEIVDNKVIQRVDRVVLNGTEDWTGFTTEPSALYRAFLRIPNMNISPNTLCDKLPYIPWGKQPWTSTEECYSIQFEESVIFIYLKNTDTLNKIKERLKELQLIFYYQLAEPIEHKITDLNSINLETFKDITYVSSENEIQPKLSFKAPVDVQATISTLRENNAQLSNELEVKTQELQEKDKELANEDDLLTAKDLDMDFRIFELEEQLTPEIAKLSMSHNSPYPMIKRCIEKGLYEKEDMLYKMNRYLHGKRLTQEEYDELKLMMG